MQEFDELQGRLGEALAANQAGSGVDHVLIALPSFSVGESLLSHYLERIPGLEHRYLLALLMLHRIESCEFAFITCCAPHPEIVDYYLSLLPADWRDSARRRLQPVGLQLGCSRGRVRLLHDCRPWSKSYRGRTPVEGPRCCRIPSYRDRQGINSNAGA